MDDYDFKQLLDALDLSWDGYRKVRKGVKKRLRRHMQTLGCASMAAYLAHIRSNASDRHECRLRLTVPISRFFRDRGLWDVIGHHLLPAVPASREPAIRVWSAGCSGGEEVFSLKIVHEEAIAEGMAVPPLYILATDLNPENIARAKTGIYPRSSLREVSQAHRNRYFAPVRKHRAAVIDRLKTGIDWQCRDLLTDPPDDRFHLVLLRNNLLTYYRESVTTPALTAIIATLMPGGYLIIGAHEKLPDYTPELRPHPLHPMVYCQRAV